MTSYEFVRVPTVPTMRVSICRSTKVIEHDEHPRTQNFHALAPGRCHTSPCLGIDEDILGASESGYERELIYLPHAASS
jgi:hypothetical protein